MNGYTAKFLLFWAIVSAIVIAMSLNTSAADARPAHVLVLHSYQHGYAWSDSVHDGIVSVLGNRPDVELIIQHMNAKYLTETDTLDQFEMLLKQTCPNSLDVILCSDDPALDFLLDHRKQLYSDVPIVFCGANGFDPQRLDGVNGITGVNEQISVRETIDMILRLRPDTRRMIVVGDTTQAGQRNAELVRATEPLFEGRLSFEYWEGLEPIDLKNALHGLEEHDVVLYISYLQSREGVILGLQESLRIISGSSPVPVFGFWDFLLGHGVTGGMVVSGKAQGEAAARLAERILDGASVDALPVIMESPNEYRFDYAQLTRFGISEQDLPAGSIVLGIPHSFWRENGLWVMTLLVFILVEAGLIAWLCYSLIMLRRTRKCIEESEARWRAYVEKAPMAVFLCDKTGHYLDVNPMACLISGYSREELLLMNLRQLLPPESDTQGIQHFETVQQEGYAEAEMIKVRKDGTRYWSQVQAVRISQDRFIAFSQDVSARKEAELANLQARQAWEHTFNAVPDLICLLDTEYRILMANRSFTEHLGCTPQEVIGKRCYQIVHGTDQPPPFCPHHRTQIDHCGHIEEIREEHLSGDFVVTTTPLFDDNGVYAGSVHVARDITRRKQYETALAVSEERQRALLAAIPDILIRIDADGRFIDCRAADQTQLLLPPDKVIGNKIQEFFPRDLADLTMNKIHEALATGTIQLFEYDLEIDQEDHWFEARMVPNGEREVLIVVRNVTEQHHAQEALAASERRLRMAQHVSKLGCWEMDSTTMQCWWSEEIYHLLRLPLEAIPTTPDGFMPYMHPEDTPRWQQNLERMLAGQPSIGTYRVHRNDGVSAFFEITGEPRFDTAGELVSLFGTVRDITDRVDAEEDRLSLERQIQQTQKLESLGVLAGGIAHDFNNLLMAILGHADIALNDLPLSSPARSNVVEIEHASRRAADLCRQMLAYSGRGRFIVEMFRLNEIVDEMTHLLGTTVSKKVLLQIHHEPNLPPMEGDATQIRQVIMNLVINASEAIGDEDGVVTIFTRMYHHTHANMSHAYMDQDLPEDNYLCIEVADTGCGMNEDTLAHLFEPFFTTKFTGRGLGMSAVLGIVRGHKGALSVESAVGSGTTFRILFPPVPVETVNPVEKSAPASVWQGTGLVLLVDDEEAIRRLGKTMLERIGFTVVTASDGVEAVGVYRREAGKIDLVLLDLTMPHMDGEETFRALREMDPNVRVVMASGYSGHEIEMRFDGQGIMGIIQKPYNMAALRDTLAHALGGA